MPILANPLSFGNFTGRMQEAAVKPCRQNSTMAGLELLLDQLSLILMFFPSQPTGFLQNLPCFLGSKHTFYVSQLVQPGEVHLFGFTFRCYSGKFNSKTSRTWTRLREATASPAQGQTVMKDMLGKWEGLPLPAWSRMTSACPLLTDLS